MKAVRDGDPKAGRAVAVQRRKLCAEIADEKGWNRPRFAVVGIM
jgi:hypothetical protein